LTIRSSREEREGSARITEAIWDDMLSSAFTILSSAKFTDCSEGSFGHAFSLRQISSLEKGPGLAAVGRGEIGMMKMDAGARRRGPGGQYSAGEVIGPASAGLSLLFKFAEDVPFTPDAA
jgi:hypothetical protein